MEIIEAFIQDSVQINGATVEIDAIDVRRSGYTLRALHDGLLCAADDSSDAEGVTTYWGIDDSGNEWQIRIASDPK